MRILKFLLLLLALSPSLAVGEETSSPPASVATIQQVDQWIADLDSNVFDDRERAQNNLTQAREQALDAVAKAAHDGSLECSTRAVNILLAWSETDDHPLVLSALEKLAGLDNHPKQATLAKELLADVRENIALDTLEKLGGSYQVMYLPQGAGWGRQQKNVHVFIGSEWKGELEGLKNLEKVPSTFAVSFHSPPLGDEALAVLEKLPHLIRVELYGTKQMTPAAIEAIKKKLTNVQKFDVRNSAFLGVQGDELTPQAVVRGVEPGSAAEVAGIKQNDVITKLDGEEIKDFGKLTGLIAQHEAGDTVTISVLRAGENAVPEEVDLKVTFAQWGKDGAGARRGFNGNMIPNVAPAIAPGNLKFDRR